MKSKKLKIGVCDNQKHVHNVVQELVQVYQNEKEELCETVKFFSGKEVINYTEELDALILNAKMFQMDGFETARKLKLRGVNYKIIMVSNTMECCKEAFKVGVFRFLTDPIEKQELFEAIDDVKQEILGMEKVSVGKDGIIYDITQRDIVYIGTNTVGTIIYTRDMKYRSNLSMENWMTKLV